MKNTNHTKLSLFLLYPSIVFMLYITIRHWSEDVWGSFAFYIQFIPGVVGLIGYQLLKRESILPWSHVGELHPDFLMRVGLIVIGVAAAQLISNIALNVSDLEYAFYVAFAAPLEEIFHRAFVITAIVTLLMYLSKNLATAWKIIAAVVSSVLFASLHFSYYGQWNLILGVFGSGMVLGLAFAFWGDITANIFAHFLWNFVGILIANITNTIVWVALLVVFGAIVALSFLGKKKSRVRVKKYNVTVVKQKLKYRR